MKNTILIFLIALGLCLSACQDFLTPEIKTDITLDTYGSTPTEANLLLNQAYVELRNDNITGSVFWQYFTTDYSVPPAGTSLARSLIAKLSYDAAEGDILNIWSAHYTAISRPNLLIEKADAALEQLLKDYPKLKPMRKSTLLAVGVDYQPRDYVLKDGDEVALFPPVQGG